MLGHLLGLSLKKNGLLIRTLIWGLGHLKLEAVEIKSFPACWRVPETIRIYQLNFKGQFHFPIVSKLGKKKRSHCEG